MRNQGLFLLHLQQFFKKSGWNSLIEYYPFGAVMPGRSYNPNESRYGYQGSEKDGEISPGVYTTLYRELDTRLGRWWSVDPLANQFPSLSPYASMNNNPIHKNDPKGMAAKNPDDYVFDENGSYVRTDKNNKPDKLVIENSKTKEKTEHTFNDPKTDVAAINYNIKKMGVERFKEIKYVFTLSDSKINSMMEESDVHYRNYFSRRIFAMNESKGGKMDFTAYHLSIETSKGANEVWDFDTELMKDYGPIFIISDQKTVYNLFDTGNWLWGNAVHRLGGSSMDARSWSLWNDPKDSQLDQRAIQNGWFYADGFKDNSVCPEPKKTK